MLNFQNLCGYRKGKKPPPPGRYDKQFALYVQRAHEASRAAKDGFVVARGCPAVDFMTHWFAPKMPTTKSKPGHSPRIKAWPDFHSSMVARPVTRSEMMGCEKGRQARVDEWKRLRLKKVWDEDSVDEWYRVAARAKANNVTAHVGMICEIFVEKNSEKSSEFRKYKCRVVFQGNNVKDQNRDWAIFQDLGSQPATLEASKAVDAHGLLKGHIVEADDAVQAYCQCLLPTMTKNGKVETWVRLPKDQWPEHWHGKYTDPVCKLVYSLYGHPDSGGHWEAHCDKHLRSVGFKPIGPEWRSTYYHAELILMLIVYVDDFKMSGPKENMPKGWELIKKGLDLEGHGPVRNHLGCVHVEGTAKSKDGKTVRTMTYDMESFLDSSVEAYCNLAGVSRKSLRKVATPFVPDSKASELPKDASKEGHLQPIAASILMKLLYAARLARFDILKAIGQLAQHISKWTAADDRGLHRLVCYVNSTLDFRLTGWVGDEADMLQGAVYSDADFAGCPETARSTTGVFLCLEGPNTRFPLSGKGVKQTCVSHSTPEAEIVAADDALRTEGFPFLTLWEKVLQRKVILNFYEDNSAAIQILMTGKNPTIRHMGRTHRVDLAWLHEVFMNQDDVRLQFCDTDKQAADIFTKPFVSEPLWRRATTLINIYSKDAYEAIKKCIPPTTPKTAKDVFQNDYD